MCGECVANVGEQTAEGNYVLLDHLDFSRRISMPAITPSVEGFSVVDHPENEDFKIKVLLPYTQEMYHALINPRHRKLDPAKEADKKLLKQLLVRKLLLRKLLLRLFFRVLFWARDAFFCVSIELHWDDMLVFAMVVDVDRMCPILKPATSTPTSLPWM